ncbi:MAG TPA: response regulator transcription factor [Candidatus Gallacutalibacter pullistercoris]|nr:response regulator transcription factor [Candidatus Gallacutalibacter pullistercoris]
MKGRILVAEDDFDIANLIRMYLENSGYSICIAENGERALEILEQAPVDLAILDVMMPKMDGIELTRHIRRQSNIPLIILSAKGKEEDRVRGLETGADVYMTKPFLPGELVAQVQASLRRARSVLQEEAPGPRGVHAGALRMDLESLTLTKNGMIVPLTSTELKILLKLMSSPGRVFTKAQLYGCINGEALRSDDNTVMVHISNLREKIEDDPRKPVYIRTIRGIGYKFDGQEKN